jgi:hypothetical protein
MRDCLLWTEIMGVLHAGYACGVVAAPNRSTGTEGVMERRRMPDDEQWCA